MKILILKYGSNIVRSHETHIQQVPYSFDRNIEEGRNALLDIMRQKREKEGKKTRREKKETGGVINSMGNDV